MCIYSWNHCDSKFIKLINTLLEIFSYSSKRAIFKSFLNLDQMQDYDPKHNATNIQTWISYMPRNV